MDFPNCRKNFIRRHILHQVSRRASLQGFEDALAVILNSQHDELYMRQATLEFTQALNARQSRQVDVHKHDVWRVVWETAYRFFRCRTRVAETKSRCGIDQLRQTLADALVVLNN